jgi:molybdopterin synthase catalytic subunit
MARVIVQAADFDAGAELRALATANTGGIASFIGVVRAADDERTLVALTLEHYPGMTEAALETIAAAAETRFGLTGCAIIHRIGRLAPGDNIVFVGTASPHRASALAATAFLIDWLKTAAPFWKSESFSDGTSEWVAARAADDQAAAAWNR